MQINEDRRNKIVNVLSDVLSRLCERNDRFAMSDSPVTRFHALKAPQITIKFYLKRIAKYSNCSEECFVLALIYIDRLIRKNGNFLVNSLNVHRLLITSIMVGAKFFDDQYFNNAYFGKVGGVSCKEINLLETEFLFMINFNLYVETAIYNTYNERLMSQARPLENNAQQQENKETKSKELHNGLTTELNAQQQANKETESKELPNGQTTEHPEETEHRAVNAPQSTIATATAETPHVSSQSRPMAAPSVMPRVRHYPTQRCTPPSPNFLKTTKRIQMKTR